MGEGSEPKLQPWKSVAVNNINVLTGVSIPYEYTGFCFKHFEDYHTT
jgi:hypothetical protein